MPEEKPAQEDVQKALERVKKDGVELEAEAIQALEKLPPEHALELLAYVAENCNYLRNPSKYITSSCARGFVPKRGRKPEAQGPPPLAADPETMERLLLKAQRLGLVLTNEALMKLAELVPEKSVELLDFVLERSQDLRDSSSFILSAVASGFTPGGHGGCVAHGDPQDSIARSLQRLQDQEVHLEEGARQALAQLPPASGAELLSFLAQHAPCLRSPSHYVYSSVARAQGAGGDGWSPQSVGMDPQHVPPDITPLERRVLLVNSTTFARGEQIDLISYLALRCLPDWHSKEMLDSLQARQGAVASPCNYIQAAVNKIQRGHQRGYDAHGEAHDGKRQRVW